MKTRIPTSPRIRAALGVVLTAIALVCMAGSTRAQTADDEVLTEPVAPDQGSVSAPGSQVLQASDESALPWPHRFEQGDLEFTIYPPELDRWQGDRLEARVAVAVQAPAADKPTFGVISLSARTETDQASGRVTVSRMAANRASFPNATDRAAAYLDAVRQHLAELTWTVSLERLRADLVIDRAAQRAGSDTLRNDPPRILYSASPAVLASIDGEPVLREMVGLDLMRVLNTRALILLDKLTGRYFIFVAGRWLQAPSLQGPWSEAQVRPSSVDDAKEQAVASGQVDLLEDDDADNDPPPQVVVSTRPAELVQTDGAPQYAPIAGTQLLYVTNSPARLFLDLSTQQHYVLLTGRWYRTHSLEQGAWEYVAGAGLPADFASIPEGHPAESVRAAVPGSPQAQEAAIANTVPQVATVKRTAARLEIDYDGTPQFRAIEGTPLEFAANAPVPVIKVDGGSFYALDNGVWFFAESSAGPWTAATSVPVVIYTIPPSSALYYVTYVRIYDSTPDTVSVGYTPGYVGSYVTSESTVVYGTGWVYRPWIGTVWYPPPATWGFGFSYWRSWWNPWRPVRWVGWRPRPCFHPAWGPWTSRAVVQRTHVTGAVRVAPVVIGNRGVGRSARMSAQNISHIYRRWGRETAVVRNEPRRFAAPTASPAAGAPRNADWQIHRRQDGLGQRFNSNRRWDSSEPRPADAPRWTRRQADGARPPGGPPGQSRPLPASPGMARQENPRTQFPPPSQAPGHTFFPPNGSGAVRIRPHGKPPPAPAVREPRPIIETPTPQQQFVVPPLGGARPPVRQPPASRPPSAERQRGGRVFTPSSQLARPAPPAGRGAVLGGPSPRIGERSSAAPRMNRPQPAAAATGSQHRPSRGAWRGRNDVRPSR